MKKMFSPSDADKRSGKFSLTENALKIIACLAMFCDHFPKVMGISGAPYFVFSLLIGRIAFPLFCFCLVEGFVHTRRVRTYLFRLLILALLSEVPYDLALHDRLLEFGNQNAVFTLAFSLLLLIVVTRVPLFHRWLMAFLALLNPSSIPSEKKPEWKQVLPSFLMPALFCFLARALRLDYGWSGILCIYLLYCLHESQRPASAIAWGCIALNLDMVSDPGAFLAVPLLIPYRGQRGSRKLKWGFYFFYPLHLLLLFVLSAIL